MTSPRKPKKTKTPEPGYDREKALKELADLVIKTMTPSGAAAYLRRVRRAAKKAAK